MTPQELWKNICQEAKNYFDFTLEWYVRGMADTGDLRRPMGQAGAGEVGSCGGARWGKGGCWLEGAGGPEGTWTLLGWRGSF